MLSRYNSRLLLCFTVNGATVEMCTTNDSSGDIRMTYEQVGLWHIEQK